MKSGYWFYIENYVHVNCKKDSALLYNPYHGIILEHTEPTIMALIRKLQVPRNMGVIGISQPEINEPLLHAFITEIRRTFMGDLLEKKYFPHKPVQMNSMVTVQKEQGFMNKSEARAMMGDNVLDYVSEVSFYLNNACSFTCDICSIAYRNFLCCTTSGNPQQELAWPKLSAFLTEIAHSGLININILGGNCLAYSHFSQLKEQLTTFKCRKTFWLHYLNISLEQQRLKQLTIANSQLKMLVSFPIQEDSFQQALESVLHENLHTTLVFMIQNDQEYQQAELLITRFQLDFVEFLPVFNGQNEQFFKENFFIDRADIQANRPPLHDIYINHSLNAADFGKLTVMADGKLYANVNDAPMGELGKDSIYPLLLNELGEKKSWRLTRKDVFPCRSCTFQMLCPTINNYNRLMKRYNLCHIR